MKSKRTLVTVAIILGLLWLAYHFLRHGSNLHSFSWRRLWQVTLTMRLWMLLLALSLSYFAYILRALRWQVLMPPGGRFWPILKGTLIGFTGVALLGRPGELIRPYYIARKLHVRFPDQMTVWVVERTFDMGTTGLLLGLALWLSPNLSALLRSTGDITEIHRGGQIILILVVCLIVLLGWIYRYGMRLSEQLHHHPATWRRKLESVLRQLSRGMHGGISSPTRLALSLACSAAMWLTIAWSTQALVLAYPHMLPDFSLGQAILLMGLVSLGSLVQLPAIGGGMQVAAALALTKFFGAASVPATSTALLLWILSFYAIAPFGVYFAAHEGISWRRAGREALAAETAATEK